MSLTDRVAVITGAGSGIGRGIALCLAGKGATVVVNDVNRDSAEDTSRMLSSGGAQSAVVVADIGSPDGAKETIDQTLQAFGRLDVLVNNAGRQVVKQITELEVSEWDLMMSVDLKAVYLCSKFAIPHLRSRRGSIINIASAHSKATLETFAAYSAAKCGVIGLTRGMALQCAPMGIRVNAVSPGFIDTPILQEYIDAGPDPDQRRRESLALQPMGRFGTPTDVGNLVAFLASDEAAFITGSEFVVDGGLTCRLFN